MSVRVCVDCTASYAVDLANCPHCRSERAEIYDGDPYRGDNMPKITRHGGATNAAAEPPGVPVLVGEPGPELEMPADGDEGGAPSPGSSSGTSTTKPPATSARSRSNRRRPARTTESHSPRAPRAASSASTTATAGPKTDADA